jgi:hypothetical protein
MTTKTLKKHGLTVVLDTNKVIHDDPGADTPALVYMGEASATYHVALHEGELDFGDVKLNPTQIRWLDSIEGEIGDFLGW